MEAAATEQLGWCHYAQDWAAVQVQYGLSVTRGLDVIPDLTDCSLLSTWNYRPLEKLCVHPGMHEDVVRSARDEAAVLMLHIPLFIR